MVKGTREGKLPVVALDPTPRREEKKKKKKSKKKSKKEKKKKKVKKEKVSIEVSSTAATEEPTLSSR